MSRESTEYIMIHCAATRADMDIGAADIDRWHRQRGWRKIGYHYVIRRNGEVETGRYGCSWCIARNERQECLNLSCGWTR